MHRFRKGALLGVKPRLTLSSVKLIVFDDMNFAVFPLVYDGFKSQVQPS